MTDHEFNVEAMVHGYHIYQSVWDAAVNGEVLNCYREVGNTHDPSVVAVRKDAVTVGHVTHATISSIYGLVISSCLMLPEMLPVLVPVALGAREYL